jgi:hypothetical protein
MTMMMMTMTMTTTIVRILLAFVRYAAFRRAYSAAVVGRHYSCFLLLCRRRCRMNDSSLS